jgi:phage terminase large subunit-like protein
MLQLREQGLRDIDSDVNSGLYFAEWSMPSGVNPRDERYWRWANPALGTTITMKALRAASSKDYFLRAHLNQWVTARGGWLEHGVWDTCLTKQEFPEGVDSVLAVDSSVNESRYVGIRAAMIGMQTITKVEFIVDTEEQMWKEIERVMQDTRCLLAITPTYEIHVPTVLRRRYTVVGYAELLRYSSLVLKMIIEGKVIAHESTALGEHMNRAVMVKTAQGAVLSSQKSAGPIELARCLVFAVSLISKPTNKQKPMLVVSQ